jgi:dephospho-CoA kinase
VLIIGLTGGIGCGKTTVSHLFEKRGVPVVDADVISHAIVQPGQPALTLLENSFGHDVLLADGSLNRTYLRELVFNDSSKKETLEGILHPIIYRTMNQDLERYNTPYGILSIPLLFETNYQQNVDRTLVVDCTVETQKARVLARDELDNSLINSIIKSQCSRSFRLAHADDILTNEGSLETLEQDIQNLHTFYLEISTRKIQ